MFRYALTESESNTVRIYAVYSFVAQTFQFVSFVAQTFQFVSFVAQTFQFVSEERVYFWGNSHLTRRATATIA